ncbi:putative membrane protein [Archaeoglobus sulfaticallidus PM70-1]|uniref:Putative membrane protein n=1 Tax=Archaeoglobus sulfaticallidus PM70-1 TaxID=387631 RepID=N0BDG1_9EURY|nr:putative sulfate exporter family transporter [Archaeoglobus sulfaticallidus]AGK61028.1 putative membrane protein [Archaeoglobus sulfaticallidus PM70-1]
MERKIITAESLKRTTITGLRDIKQNFFAVSLIITSGLLAYAISLIDPAFDTLFMALFMGIVFGSLYGGKKKEIISQKALSITLPVGIILYGSNIIFPKEIEIPPAYIAVTLISTISLGFSVYLLARANNLSNKFTTLLVCGNAICGASAIAIVSSIINPKNREFSTSIIIITVVGLTGAVIYPSLYYSLNLPEIKYALLSGSTLQQTGLVKIATNQFGEHVETLALAIKAIRIAMIAVVVLLVSFLYSDQKFYVPWYIVAFILVAFLSQNLIPYEVIVVFQPLSTLAFAITLASIGFSVNLSDIQNVGLSPLIIVYAGWCFSVIFSLLLLSFV